jgi:hypothetical protein
LSYHPTVAAQSRANAIRVYEAVDTKDLAQDLIAFRYAWTPASVTCLRHARQLAGLNCGTAQFVARI